MYEKNLLFRTHPRGLVYAAVFSVVLIGHVKTHVGTQAIPPPPPTPLFVSSPLSGVQEDRGGRGEEPLLVISCLLGPDRILSRL